MIFDDFPIKTSIYPLVICYIAIENGPVEIISGFSHLENGGSFLFFCKRLPGRVVRLFSIAESSAHQLGNPHGKLLLLYSIETTIKK